MNGWSSSFGQAPPGIYADFDWCWCACPRSTSYFDLPAEEYGGGHQHQI
jgi:hypothetical protein